MTDAAQSKGECVIFAGSLDRDGYGRTWHEGKRLSAHRKAYLLDRGPIPPGFHVDHLCSNRACINPAHLEAVTPAENTRRAKRRLTHCRHGHEFTSTNTYWRFDGLIPQRGCKVCRAAARTRQRERARTA